MKSRCRLYYTLIDVMESRASSKTLLDTEQMYYGMRPSDSDDDTTINTVSSEENCDAGTDKEKNMGTEEAGDQPCKTPERRNGQRKGKISIRNSSNKKGKNSPIIDPEALGFLDSTYDIEMEKLAEVTHHNEELKKPITIQIKMVELEYKMKLHESFKKLKDDGLSDTKIMEVSPDMKVFVN